MKKVILIRCGELTLKGLNRRTFESRLVKNMKNSLRNSGNFIIEHSQSRFFIEAGDDSFDFTKAADCLSKIPGIVSLSLAYKVQSDIDKIFECAHRLIEEKIRFLSYPVSFKADSRRGDKTFAYDSLQLNAVIGSYLTQSFGEKLIVDLTAPQVTIYTEVRESTYIYTDKIPGLGGLPLGTGGRAMLLLSGGIDSPVAGYMVMKRGVKIEAVYFHSHPYTSERAKLKVMELAKQLSEYNQGIYIHVVSFTQIQTYLKDNFDIEYLTILMRRAMMVISRIIGTETNCTALITGESIGQVASQTLDSLSATDDAAGMLVIRPLIAFDKNDIVTLSKEINTYDISIQPYEDCCTLFVAKHPKTKPKLKDVLAIEAEYVNMKEMINTAVTSREVIKL